MHITEGTNNFYATKLQSLPQTRSNKIESLIPNLSVTYMILSQSDWKRLLLKCGQAVSEL